MQTTLVDDQRRECGGDRVFAQVRRETGKE
jgi:hypothetical protein